MRARGLEDFEKTILQPSPKQRKKVWGKTEKKILATKKSSNPPPPPHEKSQMVRPLLSKISLFSHSHVNWPKSGFKRKIWSL